MTFAADPGARRDGAARRRIDARYSRCARPCCARRRKGRRELASWRFPPDPRRIPAAVVPDLERKVHNANPCRLQGRDARHEPFQIAVIREDCRRHRRVRLVKPVNDAYGHDAGDHVLAEIGRVLLTGIRGSDLACRFGGEEFAIVLPDATLEAVQRRAEDIRQSIRRCTKRRAPAGTAS